MQPRLGSVFRDLRGAATGRLRARGVGRLGRRLGRKKRTQDNGAAFLAKMGFCGQQQADYSKTDLCWRFRVRTGNFAIIYGSFGAAQANPGGQITLQGNRPSE